MTFASPDMHAFSSRLHYRGKLLFQTGHRIGDQRSLDAAAPDLPILRAVDGRPYIPGSSFKGAWRSYTEAALRTLQAGNGHETQMACLPISEAERCLPQEKVRALKEKHDDDPQARDEALRAASCWTCRVFGNGHLAAKVMVKDLAIRPDTFYRSQVRDGVAIDRDSGRVAGNQKYQYETVPAGAAFDLEIVIENAAPAELGLALLGLLAFERGDIPLGGANSRGLGWCRLTPRWEESDYVSKENLLDYLTRREPKADGVPLKQVETWLTAFKTAAQNA